MTSGSAGDGDGTLKDLLAERFGDPEGERYTRPPSEPWPSDSAGPTQWWSEELRRKSLAEEVESDDVETRP